MKIELKTGADSGTEVYLSEVYSGVGIRTEAGLFGIAERDGGIEVMLNGKTVWARGASPEDLPNTLPPPPAMTEERAAEMAKVITKISSKVGPVVRDEQEHLAVAIALTTMAAHHILHDGGTEEDFLQLCRMSWAKSTEAHAKSCGKN
jgi:hypothetical protein